MSMQTCLHQEADYAAGTGKCPIQMGRQAAIPIRLNGSDSE
jgi:hypothetical protein